MNISTQLTHLDDRLAVCAATLQDGEKRVSVYASALAAESGLYPDVAQKRAVELALNLHEKGVEIFRDLEFSVRALPIVTAAPVFRPPAEPTNLAQGPFPSESESLVVEEPVIASTSSEDSEVAPW